MNAIPPGRIHPLNSRPERRGSYVLYWMQASQRAGCNHALEYAVTAADRVGRPLLVYFGLTDRFPEANARHYRFMLEGLKEVEEDLRERGIQMVVRRQSPPEGACRLGRKAALVVVDAGYLRIQREWRAQAARALDCPLIEVESDVVVPVREASAKEEYSAATFRPRLKKALEAYLVPLEERAPERSSLEMEVRGGTGPLNVEEFMASLDLDRTVPVGSRFRGGPRAARRALAVFLRERLDAYAEERNDPTVDGLSNMSPYLHFGQISPIEIALKVREAGGPGADAYLDELLVRRELSVNYVFYNPFYDSFQSLPAWAGKTLGDHAGDRREFLYTLEELDRGATHDPYWNAAQKEMILTGKMHGYMRMYWGKKILEWTPSPETSFRYALHLNNRYELDGRDPNAFAGVAWCFGKHDRPWAERKVFGKVRYMSAGGLERKFDAAGYCRKIAHMEEMPSRSAGGGDAFGVISS